MKRYTSFTDDYPVVTSDHCWEDQNEDYCGPAIERLAEYEATGLMPAEVAALQYQLRHAMGVQRWIPVTERLPDKWRETDEEYFGEPIEFIVHICGAKCATTLCFDGTEFFDMTMGEIYPVSHWMPMPEPPNAEPDYMTNADIIRAMSDRELANLLATKFADLQADANGLQMTATQLSVLQRTWFRAWMQWLQQPAEES